MTESRYIETSGGPIHARISGTQGSRVVVAVHGLGGSARNWDSLAGLLGGQVVAVDLPGFGLSPPRRGDQLEAQVGAVCQILEALDLSDVTLIGNSMGGLVAQSVSALQRNRVRLMVLVSPATPLPPRTPPADPGVAATLLVQSLPLVGSAITRRLLVSSDPATTVERTMGIVAAHRGAIAPTVLESAIDMATIRRSMPWAVPTFSASAAAVRRRLVGRSEFIRRIETIAVPTMLVWGEQDRVVSPASMRWLASLRPDWHTVELADVGHVPMMEAPATTAEAVLRWETLARDPEGRGYPEGPGLVSRSTDHPER